MPSIKTSLFRAAALALVACRASASDQQQKPLTFPHGPAAQENLQTTAALDEQIPDAQPPSGGNWLGWGAGVYNNRWAGSDAVVDASNVANLTKVCSVQYATAGQSAPPLVTGGVAYYPTWTGLLEAVDYRLCERVWTVNVTRIIDGYRPGPVQNGKAKVSRTTPALGDDGETLFVGTVAHALVLALDRRTGRLVDSLQLDAHPFAILTQSPTFYDGRLYAGVSSSESAAFPGHPCCSFVGSLHAVALRRGRLQLLWSAQTIPRHSPADRDDPKFSGAAVWGSQPSIDPIRRQVFVGTGQLYSLPPEFEECQRQTANVTVIRQGLTGHDPCLPRTAYQNSILALDLDTGRVNWARQLGPLDAWNAGCIDFPGVPPNPGACPDLPGQDADFGMAPTFVLGSAATPFGVDMVVAGQKNGMLWGLCAATGTTAWATQTGPGGLEGGLTWGVAVDDAAVYFVNTNSEHRRFAMPGSGGDVVSNSAFGAASLADGRILWLTPAPHNHDSYVAPAVVNDVVLVGTSGARGDFLEPVGPGYLTPLDKRTGSVLRRIKLDAVLRGGPATVGEYVFFGTGYGGIHTPEPGSFNVWKINGEGARTVEDEAMGEL
ncbi:hypothetical protein M0657_010983 [Pyricularia oryzae]|uniref:Quinon protein alcohol dehydrogenase-like superfamily n=2 Tax=Pyricularia oryzae TaxID=318829 RepID=A0AA97NSN5_PYRO3|nr:hypothetical protein OOU_Y34scaffold00696g2 [Pyricularia oryzae Y34]KAI7910230.1 hypothetical protein M9X92_011220 [Pyricularia oryzae]KAI7911386.1 hypothetical protein M0657_010983 [Pyricularia oryzae]